MVKIVHFEVYADKGDGWKLVDQYSSDQRQEAVNLAKELEEDARVSVKIIREIFDVQDNTYQESVEYVGSKGRKKRTSTPNNKIPRHYSGEYNVEYEKPLEENKTPNLMTKAIVKLITIILVCLVLSHILVGLLEPIVETLIPEDGRKTALFFIFFAVFIIMTVPVIMKKVPWSAFYANTERKKIINERRFFNKAEAIIRRYNLNDEYDEGIAPVYPEAPLEHKRYIIEFLSQILGNMEANTNLQDSYTRLGIKLVIYGGCMELSRYCGLIISEANSLLYEAFKILDGDNSDLQSFYEAKRSYKDNKVAIFLTGVGAYLMAQIIKEEKMDAYILKATIKKWLSLNKTPEIEKPEQSEASTLVSEKKKEEAFDCMTCLKTAITFYDDEQVVSEDDELTIRAQVRNLITDMVAKFEGEIVLEGQEIVAVHFSTLSPALSFVHSVLSDIENYKEQSSVTSMILDCRSCIVKYETNDEDTLTPYLQDIFEHTYNNEIILQDEVKDELNDSNQNYEFLGEKHLSRTNSSLALYKLCD